MAPHSEDFARWRVDRVTQWVFQAFRRMSAEQQAEWMRTSWDNGVANPNLLTELRTRADAYAAIEQSDYTDFCDANGDEPNDAS